MSRRGIAGAGVLGSELSSSRISDFCCALMAFIELTEIAEHYILNYCHR